MTRTRIAPFHDPLSKEIHTNTAQNLDRFPVRVFLCGAGISRKRHHGRRKRSVDIRTFVKARLTAEVKRCTVRLGEHKENIRAFNEAIGLRMSNLADHEFSLVRNQMDLVIIFPRSPGSFAELGMFCLPKQVAQKMCILTNAKYKKSTGYLMQGPVRAAEQNKAQVVFVDYSKRRRVWEEVKEVVLQVKAGKRRQRLLTP